MSREDALNFLKLQLVTLKQLEVAELMKHQRVEELKEIDKKLDFSILKQFCNKNTLELQIYEIPNNCEYELAFYARGLGIKDSIIFVNWQEFSVELEMLHEPLGDNVVNLMECYNLCECTIEQLVGVSYKPGVTY